LIVEKLLRSKASPSSSGTSLLWLRFQSYEAPLVLLKISLFKIRNLFIINPLGHLLMKQSLNNPSIYFPVFADERSNKSPTLAERHIPIRAAMTGRCNSQFG